MNTSDPSQPGPDDALVQQLMALGAVPDLQHLLYQQMGYGNQLYQTPSPEGRHVGNTYVASSPLEHMSAALQRYMGGKQMQEATQGLQRTFQQQTEGRTRGMAEALRRLLGGQQAPAEQPVMPMEY